MRFALFQLLSFFFTISAFGQSRFINPIKGNYGSDYIIANYVDWGPEDEVFDHHCLSKTYNGHQGTDYVIRSFKQMDIGVDVVAVDDGTVIFVQDGLFDREKESVIAKGLGNYVGIAHQGKLHTYYAHLKKNSIVVKVGDKVKQGDLLGEVASSGNSSDPHLHFELWYDSTYYIDPYLGPCGNSNGYFINPDAFDSSFGVWSSALWTGIPTLDTLREEPQNVDTFNRAHDRITQWSILYGLRNNDNLKVEWRQPDGTLWHEFEYSVDQDWWYYYDFSSIEMNEKMGPGKWTVDLFRNDEKVNTRTFELIVELSTPNYHNWKNQVMVSQQVNSLTVKGMDIGRCILFNLEGQIIDVKIEPNKSHNIYPLKPGIYLLQIPNINTGQSYFEKIIIQ